MVADISDIQSALDMTDAASEILGFSPGLTYSDKQASQVTAQFNAGEAADSSRFAPVMGTLRTQSGLADYFDLLDSVSVVLISGFVIIMSIVLWNAGLMASLRRYGEIGMRLALGESKGHIYRTLLLESLMVGMIGSVLGTALGLAISYYMQFQGFNISAFMKGASMMMSDVMRARVTPVSYAIGFAPGLAATFLGTAISGLGVYQRQTAQLTKELET